MASVVITGASRGIGLEFVRQYAAEGWRVHASCRDPEGAADLKAVAGDISVYKCDVRDFAEIDAFAAAVGGAPVDVLINNAGIIGHRENDVKSIDYEIWDEVLRVNTLGPTRMIGAFLDNVAESEHKLIVSVSSILASIGRGGGGRYHYRSSKAALNAVMRAVSADVARIGVTVVMVHPGHVSSDMGGPSAPVTPAASVGALKALIAGFGPDDNGRFYNYTGEELPW